MNDFEALLASLFESALGYIGKDHLRQLVVFGDEVNSVAQIEICLDENSWAEQTRAIDKMLELRAMFLDELSIDYDFVDEDACTHLAAERSAYAYA